jgi:hypothetical protein
MSSESNFSVTVKTPKGSLVTVRGDEASEFVARIEEAVERGMEFHIDMLEKVISGQGASAPVKQDPVAIVQQAMGGTVINSTPVEPWEQEQSGFAPVPPPQQAAPAGIETVQDRWGSSWTYGRTDAPICPNGPMVLKKGVNQSGKSYVGWFDPAGGPRWQGEKIDSKLHTKPVFGVKV